MEDYADRITSNVQVILACKDIKNGFYQSLKTKSSKCRLGPSDHGVPNGFLLPGGQPFIDRPAGKGGSANLNSTVLNHLLVSSSSSSCGLVSD